MLYGIYDLIPQMDVWSTDHYQVDPRERIKKIGRRKRRYK